MLGKEWQNLRRETCGDAVAVISIVCLEIVSDSETRERLIQLRIGREERVLRSDINGNRAIRPVRSL